MAKRKRKNDEYYFDVFLDCGSVARDKFGKVMETHDYFIALDKHASMRVKAKSLDTGCRYTIGIYDPENKPIEVQIVNPAATVHLKKARSAGEYIVRLRCESVLEGEYRITVDCNPVHSIWSKLKALVTGLPKRKIG